VTVLITDDFSPIRDILNRMLSAIPGIDLIAEASDGDQTQEMIKALKPDALILDIRIPSKTGLDILRDPSYDLENTTFIILTTYATPALRQRYLALGADHVLDKTMEFAQVPEIMTTLAEAKLEC
jgi:DNA-binding NarL/FixJ family response regulator